ncbi:MAG TPA: heavy metal-binding domain-containing protein [Candidatus Saccharimonadales bacterium]|nr:heavy metal-binding domain-containing protein [Candidatus Saccharimonadales bacterium]
MQEELNQGEQVQPGAEPAKSQPSAGGPEPKLSAFSGLSGNEMFCVDLIGYKPGNLLVGNSIFSMGVLGGLKSLGRGFIGGEVKSFTEMIAEGRRLSFERLAGEMESNNAHGVSGVGSELVFHGTNAEFLSIGSALHAKNQASGQAFTSSSDGQELFCQVDVGYEPKSFVFGNVAYSIGVSRGITGAFKKLVKGEVRQYTEIFTSTRNLALQRITDEAKAAGANAVVGIRTSILPYGTTGVQEMVMIGTASTHALADHARPGGVITSDLTAEEMWNVAKMGYMPQQLVIGTSVYSVGFVGGFKSFLRGFVKGEITEMTQLIYGAREESLKKVQAQADELGADDVLGLRTYIYSLGGGLIEFLVIGTAVKKVEGIKTRSEQLPPQAIIRDKDTFVNRVVYGVDLNMQGA